MPGIASYPDRSEVDAWLDSIWDLVDTTAFKSELLPDQGFTHNFGIRHAPGFQYVRFSPAGMTDFYGYWQPVRSFPAPPDTRPSLFPWPPRGSDCMHRLKYLLYR